MIGQPDLVVSLLAETRECLPGLRAVSQLLCELEIPHETLCGRGTGEDIVQYARSSERRGIRVIVAAAPQESSFVRRLVAGTLVPVLALEVTSSGSARAEQALELVLTIGAILALDDTHARGPLAAFRAAHGIREDAMEPAVV